ncbi:molybdopterin-dependent oxidoreductase [Xanthocytophaga flava]|uniref:molybdopterin-dependent oxidoreductase n=1 Tax=Xanthocytophaga flava TaxID=3048013 RepID=UPI0028D29040|nr:molybdopterin-dependent oxidoreductase [Xanthocytophaga flavus]MDJ1466919.1 molybdopterin-dependent oxidoreductase [Xanthocytophaga flavus]
MENKELKRPSLEATIDKKIKRRTFISFASFFALSGLGLGAWKWLYNSPEEISGITAGAHKPLRDALNTSEQVFKQVYSNTHLVKTYPKSMAATDVRVNGDIGLTDETFRVQDWQLEVEKEAGKLLTIGIEQLKKLPKTEIIYSFKCIEGWDQIQHWGGLSFSDFIQHFNLESQSKKAYVGMQTPDEQYYVGIDRESALHPQTILAYEMNGHPIPVENGAPLRLIIPVKYGVKNLKRIGRITFSDTRPRDFWAEQGYDYYSGL